MLLVQNTLAAVHRLGVSGIIDAGESRMLKEAYLFFRTVEGLLRLKGEGVLKKDEESLKNASEFMEFSNPADFAVQLERMRAGVVELSEKYLRDS
jgi:glutamine synthetase adenylyltransferase